MAAMKAEGSSSTLELTFSDLIRQAVRAEVQDIVRLTIDEVAQRLGVSKDWVYRNGRRLTFTKKLGPKMVR